MTGQNIQFQVGEYAKESNITIKAEKSGVNIKVSVIDEGVGINEEDKTKVFDMFYTSNNQIADSRRGLGLGLALCKAVVEAHHGYFAITDNKPCGTIFSFVIKSGAEKNDE